VWPTTGVFTLQLQNGHFTYSPYDSEAPLAYRGEQSSVKLHSLATDKDYFVETAVNGGFIVRDIDDTDGYFLYYNANRTLQSVVPNEHYKFYQPRTK